MEEIMTKQITILLVDDEQSFLENLDERMKLKGFNTVLASSGEEALEKAREHHIDAAIVDLKMPGMDGLVCIAKLKEIHHGLKTVLLTGYGDAKVKEATEGLESVYFEKGEMGRFWEFIKNLPHKMESTMASAGYAEEGDAEGAMNAFKEKKK
jgi:DNA-binding NtrC family response regulator